MRDYRWLPLGDNEVMAVFEVAAPREVVVQDRRYAHPLNLPVLGMALAAWVVIALIVWAVLLIA